MGKDDSKSKKDSKTVEKKKVEAPVKEVPYNALTDLQRNLSLLDKCVRENTLEKISRVLRNTTRIRQSISKKQLEEAISSHLPPTAGQAAILAFCANITCMEPAAEAASAMDTDDKESPPAAVAEDVTTTTTSPPPVVVYNLPEVECYLHLLVLSGLHMSRAQTAALKCAKALIERANALNRRTLDALTAKAYGYYALCHQSANTLPSIRHELTAAHRTACLQHNEIGQATLLNLLLQNFTSENLYDLAFKLLSKTTFPEAASNNQFVRYLYYVGKIQAIQLDYTEAHTKLMQAMRKAPQNTALGFRMAVNKLAITVQLLMGEIPERSMFYQTGLMDALQPYLELTNAVRVGNLVEFNAVMSCRSDIFKQDNIYTLILRLRHNVIKTGLRKINISYSRISFTDICTKLALDTPENAEFVCAKAIFDGVIDAVIDHSKGWLQSKEMIDVYSTEEPQQAFHKRITFCLDVHNEAVKAMRYPPDAYKAELESAEERAKREKQDEELAKEIKDELDEEDAAGGGL